MKYDDRKPMGYLLNRADLHKVENIALRALDDTHFLEQSGCAHKLGHHYGKGGLFRHTYEVCVLCESISAPYKKVHNIKEDELFLSALFHDYGKIWDYELDSSTGEFTSAPHKRTIHHISRSAIEWNIIARSCGYDSAATDRITHNILAHHGQRQYGSPVAPKTREAFILYLCDSLSARIDDCDKLDLIDINHLK